MVTIAPMVHDYIIYFATTYVLELFSYFVKLVRYNPAVLLLPDIMRTCPVSSVLLYFILDKNMFSIVVF